MDFDLSVAFIHYQQHRPPLSDEGWRLGKQANVQSREAGGNGRYNISIEREEHWQLVCGLSRKCRWEIQAFLWQHS